MPRANFKYFKIKPKYKKSIYEYSLYSNDDKTKTFELEEMYRWGHVVIKVKDEEELKDIIGDKDDDYNEFEIDEFEEAEVDDCCSVYFNNCEGITSEELEKEYEDRGFDLFEEDYGGSPDEFWKVFHGQLIVEDVTDEYTK